MKILRVTPSPEPCVEAGWHASQYYLDGPVTKQLVRSLRPLGSLLLLEHLRQPFGSPVLALGLFLPFSGSRAFPLGGLLGLEPETLLLLLPFLSRVLLLALEALILGGPLTPVGAAVSAARISPASAGG